MVMRKEYVLEQSKIMEEIENAAYEEARKWIFREKPKEPDYYQIKPEVNMEKYNQWWHCFYIRKDCFEQYIMPYIQQELERNKQPEEKMESGKDIQIKYGIIPVLEKEIRFWLKELAKEIKADCQYTDTDFLLWVKWEFYHTFLTYVKRIYFDFLEEQPSITIRLIP